MFASTLGDDGIRQVGSDGRDLHVGSMICANWSVFLLVRTKISNGKTKRLGTLPIHLRKPLVLVHYWLLATTGSSVCNRKT